MGGPYLIQNQSCKKCSAFLRVKFQVFKPSWKFCELWLLQIAKYTNYVIPISVLFISYWLVLSIDQLVDCVVSRRVFHIQPSTLTSNMLNLPHGWYPHTRSFFATQNSGMETIITSSYLDQAMVEHLNEETWMLLRLKLRILSGWTS